MRYTRIWRAIVPCFGVLAVVMLAWFMTLFDREIPQQKGRRVIDPDHPCGVVAIALTSHLLGTPISLQKVWSMIDLDPHRRASLGQLVSCLRANGFEAVGAQIEPGAMSELGEATVAILFVDESHFVVATRDDAGMVQVYDPPAPLTRTALDVLPFRWEGQCILASRDAASLRVDLDRLGIRKDIP